jgi:hypothetical protein
MTDKTLIDQHICPVCHVPRRARRNPSMALAAHIKRSKDPAHVAWKLVHWATHYRHGGDKMENREYTMEMVKHAVAVAFGEEWAARVH